MPYLCPVIAFCLLPFLGHKSTFPEIYSMTKLFLVAFGVKKRRNKKRIARRRGVVARQDTVHTLLSTHSNIYSDLIKFRFFSSLPFSCFYFYYIFILLFERWRASTHRRGGRSVGRFPQCAPATRASYVLTFLNK